MTAFPTPNEGLDIMEPRAEGILDDREVPLIDPLHLDHAADRSRRVLVRQYLGRLDWSAGLFGWLVAVAVAVLVTAIVAVLLTALGWDRAVVGDHSVRSPWVQTVPAAALCGVLLAYYAGGYVAARMSRFHGGMQGLGVWVVGLVVLSATTGLGLGLKWQHDGDWLVLPRLVAAGALGLPPLLLPLALLFCLLAALAGGEMGRRCRRKLDAELVSRPERRTELAEAALSVVAVQGMGRLTHRAVDETAHVPSGTTAIYFQDRPALVAAVKERLEQRDTVLLKTLSGTGAPLCIEQVAAQLANVAVALTEQHLDLTTVRLTLSLDHPDVRPEAHQRLVASLEAALATLDLPDSRSLARTWAEYIDGLILHLITTGRGEPLNHSDISSKLIRLAR